MKNLMLNVEFLIFNLKLKIHHSKLPRSGFTMVELIFVIVMIGILSYVGSTFMPDNRLSNDTKFILSKIREKQKNAIGYDSAAFGQSSWAINNSHVCVDINTTVLKNEDNRSQKPYEISSKLNMDGNRTICFDNFGRPYQSEHLLFDIVDINITKGSRVRHLQLFPMSGYVTIIR